MEDTKTELPQIRVDADRAGAQLLIHICDCAYKNSIDGGTAIRPYIEQLHGLLNESQARTMAAEKASLEKAKEEERQAIKDEVRLELLAEATKEQTDG
ncbi:MAG TPA: hypothetical protein ENH62_08815 [Marinobacter sp.]|uniref:Uncharacterized protein n=1 Tax=marine sediment metagenome TaxID=412755 RepID=A0A0F9JX00_9ZZZZ|nr:hypothetical protein [Marinobacter sp.]